MSDLAVCPPPQMHLAGQQKMFNIFSLRSGGAYIIQVRCKPDHGFWSEWSSPFQIRVPDCKNTVQSYNTQSLPLHICHPYNNTTRDWKLYKKYMSCCCGRLPAREGGLGPHHCIRCLSLPHLHMVAPHEQQQVMMIIKSSYDFPYLLMIT